MTTRSRFIAAAAVVGAIAAGAQPAGASAAIFPTLPAPHIINLGPTGPLGPLGSHGPLGGTSNLPTGWNAWNLGPSGPLGPGGALGPGPAQPALP